MRRINSGSEPLVFKIGTTHEGGEYFYDTEKASNFHISLLGNSGVGKSFNMQKFNRWINYYYNNRM